MLFLIHDLLEALEEDLSETEPVVAVVPFAAPNLVREIGPLVRYEKAGGDASLHHAVLTLAHHISVGHPSVACDVAKTAIMGAFKDPSLFKTDICVAEETGIWHKHVASTRHRL